MSIATRAATCTTCNKRLNRKSWYYRNGKYFCTKRCWTKEQAKAQQEQAEKAKAAEPAKDETAKQEAAKPNPA